MQRLWMLNQRGINRIVESRQIGNGKRRRVKESPSLELNCSRIPSSPAVLPERTKWRGPRTEAAGFIGTTWPLTSQSNRCAEQQAAA